MNVAKRILFVGEDQPLWEEFRRVSPGPEGDWEAEYAHNEPEALGWIEQGPFTAVVADVHLSDTGGLDVLDEVMRRQPRALRIVLSDLDDAESTIKCVGKGHHHLMKPCDVATLLHALQLAIAMESWLPSAAVQSLISRMRWTPSCPALYFQIVSEIQSPSASVERIGDLIAQDPAIAAKVLQLANSAVFGLQLQVIHPAEAVIYLGLETTKALVLWAHTFSSFEHLRLSGFSSEHLWRHSLLVGRFARQIAQLESSGPEVSEQAFAAGLLHDLGKLMFAANLPRPFMQALAQAREHSCSLWETETPVLGATHAELGACLLGIWGLPSPIVEAIALHHHPLSVPAQAFSPLTAVHAANVLAYEASPDPTGLVGPTIDLAYLRQLGLEERFEEWSDHCLASQSQRQEA